MDGMAAGEGEEVVEVTPGARAEEAKVGMDTTFRGGPTAGWGESLTPVLVELEVLSAEEEEAAVLLEEGALPEWRLKCLLQRIYFTYSVCIEIIVCYTMHNGVITGR